MVDSARSVQGRGINHLARIAHVAKGPDTGDPAPDFELPGTDGTFKLSEHRGERVVLLFYPGDNTAVCTKQFCSYRDREDDMSSLNATVVGISPQSVASHEDFIASNGLTVPLLADEDKSVGEAYGCSSPMGFRRSTFVIDEDGIVRHRNVHTLGLRYESVDDLKAVLDELPARAA
jgi:peroxiredoxin Q/BCP